MFRKIYYFALIWLVFPFSSCIKNDIPYPYLPLAITSIEGEGFKTKSIDPNERVVTLELEETTNLRTTKITDVQYNESDVKTSVDIVGVQNLESPLFVTLLKYQKFDWTICATQPIKRYFNVVGQLGDEVIDETNRTITAKVSKTTDLKNVEVTKLKVGPSDISTFTPEMSELTNFTDDNGNPSYRRVYVSYNDVKNEDWKLYVIPSDVAVSFAKCDVWATKAFIRVAGDTNSTYGVKYRKGSNSENNEWIEVAKDDIKVDAEGGAFSAIITSLDSETTYQFRAYCGDDISEVVEKISEPTVKLENSGFENWSYSKGGTSGFVLPYAEGGYPFWSSGNEGTNIGGKNVTTGIDDPRPGSSGVKAAQLKSDAIMGVFAAGNLFVGEYLKTAGTSGGIVGFGTQFTSRPTALRGWVKYNCGIVDKQKETPPGNPIPINSSDMGIIYVAVGTWTAEEYGVTSKEEGVIGTERSPVIVDTRDKTTLFNPKAKDVVGYGEMVFTKTVGDWMHFEIPIVYNSTSIVPTHLIIVCSASRYGDYFAGSTNSILTVDDFELIYE